jgi:uncharacterized membrane protein YhfC
MFGAYDNIPGIYVASLIVSTIGMGIIGLTIFIAGGRNRRLFWFLLIGLPLSPIANVALKQPVVSFLSSIYGTNSLYGAPFGFLLLMLLMGPIIEELIKLFPLAFRWLKQFVRGRNHAIYCGLAVGMGFGLGENWYLAYLVCQNDPITAMMQFYLLSGFIVERCLSLVAHSIFSAVAYVGVARRGILRTMLISGAILIHALSNLPALLFQMGTVTDQTASNLLIAFVSLMLVVFICVIRAIRNSGAIPR